MDKNNNIRCPHCGADVFHLEVDARAPPQTQEAMARFTNEPRQIRSQPLPWSLRDHLPSSFRENPTLIYSSWMTNLTAEDEAGRVISVTAMAFHGDIMSGHFEGGKVSPDHFLYTVMIRPKLRDDFIKMVSFSSQTYKVSVWVRQPGGYLKALCWFSKLKVVASDQDTLTVILKGKGYEDVAVDGAGLKLYTIDPEGSKEYEVIGHERTDITLKLDNVLGQKDIPVRYYEVYKTIEFPVSRCGDDIYNAFLAPAKRSFDVVISLFDDHDYPKVIGACGGPYDVNKTYRLRLWENTTPPHRAAIIEEFVDCHVIDADSFGRILLRTPRRLPS